MTDLGHQTPLSCLRCGGQGVHVHHRKLRSQGGDDSEANLVRLCLECHVWVHANPAEAYESGFLVHSWDDPEVIELAEGEKAQSGSLVPLQERPGWTPAPSASSVTPGEKCPTCQRRVNHPKKETSPTTKVFSVRVPLDDLEAWEEALDVAADHLGIRMSSPHHRFKTLNAGLALILQAPKGLLE